MQKFTHRNVGWDSIFDTAVQNFANLFFILYII